jgi:hypothetical protein
MSTFLSSQVLSIPLSGQRKVRRPLGGADDFGACFEATSQLDKVATQSEDVVGIAATALLAASAHFGEPLPPRRPSQAVIDDALATLRRLQMLLLGHSSEDFTLRKLEELASELDEAVGHSPACRSIALRLRIEILRRTPAALPTEG